MRKRVLPGLISVLSCLAIATLPSAQAQDYPSKLVNIIMPWGDGFPANSTRLYAEELGKRLGQTFVVQPKPGAGGEVAAKQVMTSAADGYTLLVTGSSITIRAATDDRNADGERDLTPIAQITTTPYVIVAKKGRYGDFDAWLAEAKSPDSKVDFASAGVGTGMHYLGELINIHAGTSMVHVPYGSGAKQLQAVLAGDVDVAIISLVTALPQIQAGALEPLAVSSTQRSSLLPKVPTLVEQGLKDIPSIGAWIAMFGPKDMEPAALARLSQTVSEIAKDPAVIERVASWGAEIPDTGTEYLSEVIRAEKASWSRLIKEQNLPTAS